MNLFEVTFFIPRMEYLYILKLADNKYYVGKTKDITKRYLQHQSADGCEWTCKYPPISIILSRELTSSCDEDNTTKALMETYGINNVRGGSYCQTTLPNFVIHAFSSENFAKNDEIFINRCSKCARHGHKDRDCTTELYAIQASKFTNSQLITRHSENTCFKCGEPGHFARYCLTKVNCDFCGFGFQSKNECESHEKQCRNRHFHNPCLYCDKTFQYIREWRNHIELCEKLED